MFREFFEKLGYTKTSNAHSSYLLVVFEIGSIVGSILCGQVTNRYKNYYLQIWIGTMFWVVSLICVLICYDLLVLVAIYVL